MVENIVRACINCDVIESNGDYQFPGKYDREEMVREGASFNDLYISEQCWRQHQETHLGREVMDRLIERYREDLIPKCPTQD